MPITSTQQQDLLKLGVGMFNASLGGYIGELASAVAPATGTGMTIAQLYETLANSSAFKGLNFAYSAASTNAQFATYYAGQALGSSVSAANVTVAATYLQSLLDGGATRGSVMKTAVDFLSGAAALADTTWGAAAQQFVNKVTVATDYTITQSGTATTVSTLQATVSAVTSTAASVTAAIAGTSNTSASGQTYTLTTGIDTITGTGGADTFVALASDAALTSDTYSAADTINGGAGTDVLSITYTGTNVATTLPAATVTGIETINVRALQSTIATITTVTASNFVGATSFNADRAISAESVTGLVAGQSVGMIGNGAALNGALTATYGSTVTAGVFNISGGTTGGSGVNTASVLTEVGAGITSNTINSTGASNALNNVVLSGSANVALTINATTNLSTGNITGFTGTTSKITVAGAATSVNLGTIEAATVKTIDASGLTAGGVTATLNAQTGFNFTGGAGADVVTLGSVLVTGGMVDGGAGTADRVVINNTTYVTAATAPFIKNFEGLQVSTGAAGTTVDATMLAANNTISTIRIADAGPTTSSTGTVSAGTTTGVTGLTAAQAAAVTITSSGLDAAGSSGITIGITGATGVQVDTLKAGLTTTTSSGAAQNQNLAGIVLTGIEKVNLTGSGTATATTGSIVFDASAATAMDTLTFTNAGNGNVLTVGAATGLNLLVDASASAGTTTIDATAYNTTTGSDLRGGSGNDTIYGSAKGDVINGGAGNDAIYADATTAGTAEVQTVTIAGGAVTTAAGNVTIGGVNTFLALTNTAAQSETAILANASAIMTANPTIASITGNGAGVLTITYQASAGDVAQIASAWATGSTSTVQTFTAATGTPGVAKTNLGGTIHAGADILTGGDGKDTFYFTAGAAATVAVAPSITDLNLGTNVTGGAVDALNIDGLTAGNSVAATGTVPTLVTLTTAQQTTVTNSATLAAAVDAVLAVTNATNAVAQFTYGTDTYLILDGAGGANTYAAGDFLIKITGVTGTLDASDIIIV